MIFKNDIPTENRPFSFSPMGKWAFFVFQGILPRVHKEGIHQLSLRKVAAICDVSHVAPYKHFKDKDSLLDAMQLHITEQFSNLLSDIVEEHQKDTDIMHDLDHAYLRFFIENPHYYHFIFGQIDIHINLENEDKENYPPYHIFKNITITVLEEEKIPKEKFTQDITAMWALFMALLLWQQWIILSIPATGVSCLIKL